MFQSIPFQSLPRGIERIQPSIVGKVLRDPSGFLSDVALARVSGNPTVSKLLRQASHVNTIFNEIDIAIKEVRNKHTPVKEVFNPIPRFDSRTKLNARDPEFMPQDPLLNYQWFAIIPGILNQGEYINEISTPAIRYDQQQKFKNGKIHHYPGFFSVDDITMSIYTDISRTALDVAKGWMRTIRSNEGLYGTPNNSKKDVYVVLLDQNDSIIWGWRYIGCWPTTWDSYQLQMTSASLLVTNLTLSVDDVEFVETL